jgi:hypothetical protein
VEKQKHAEITKCVLFLTLQENYTCRDWIEAHIQSACAVCTRCSPENEALHEWLSTCIQQHGIFHALSFSCHPIRVNAVFGHA